MAATAKKKLSATMAEQSDIHDLYEQSVQAAWRLMHGLSARQEVLIAKYWASEGGQKVVHLCQHLHGGMGSDIDYPIHRYFLWIKQAEFTLGSGTAQLLHLGKHLADTPV